MRKVILTAYQLFMAFCISFIWIGLSIQGAPAKWGAPQWTFMTGFTLITIAVLVGVQIVKKQAYAKEAAGEL